MEAKIYNYKTWIEETDPTKLKHIFENMLLESGFDILNHVEHFFKPYGYTSVWLLSESHLAIHTFPERNRTYIELSSCNEEKNERFIHIIKNRIDVCEKINQN